MPRFDEVTCGGVQALLEPYVDGELPEREAERLRAHLERCPECAAELRLATAIRGALRDFPELEAPPYLVERTLADIQHAGGDAGWQSAGGETGWQSAGRDAGWQKPGSAVIAEPTGPSAAPRAGTRQRAETPWRSRRSRRFALPVAAGIAALLVAALLLRLPGTGSRASQAGFQRQQAPPSRPSAAEVALGIREARYALAYVGQASRQAGLTLRDEVLERRVVLPATLSAMRPLHPTLGFHPEPPARKGT